MRARSLAGAIGLGCAGLTFLTVLTFATPATGEPRSREARPCGSDCPTAEGPVAADCGDASMNTAAPDGSGGVKLTADIPDGSQVAPGQDIAIRLTWDPKQWSGEDLDMALACTWVKGGLNPDMSGQERPTANDGVFEYSVEVPGNIRPGCDICIQGFLAGMTDGGGSEQVGSDRRCFMSGSPTPPATTPVTSPPPATTDTTAPRVATEVGGVQASQPAPAPLQPAPAAAPAPTPAVAPAAELPRTGSPITDLATAGGGLTLALGGLGVMGGAGRRSRRRTNG
jgi:hypothetical protein